MPTMTMPARLGKRERALLLVPMLLAGVFGVGLLLIPGNRFVGAEGVGLVAALSLALRRGDWATARLPVMAALAISLAALYACIATVVGGGAASGVYLTMGAMAVAAASAGMLLLWRRGTLRRAPNVGRGLVWFLALRTTAAWLLGVGPLLFPSQFVSTFGLVHVNLFLYRLGGAGLLGYAVMGLGELRSRCGSELRAPATMVLMLASLCAVVSIASLVLGERSSLGYVVAILAPAVVAGTIIELRHASG